MTDDIRPHCWRICHRCLFPVEMLGAPAKTRGSSESVRETHYSPKQEWKNMFPLWRGYEKRASPEETRFMHLATLSRIKLARRTGRMQANRVAPELIIVYYSAGADVNIHTSGHFPFVHMQVPPANGVCGRGCAVFSCRKLRRCHTFESPSGNWLQHCSQPKLPGGTKDVLSDAN